MSWEDRGKTCNCRKKRGGNGGNTLRENSGDRMQGCCLGSGSKEKRSDQSSTLAGPGIRKRKRKKERREGGESPTKMIELGGQRKGPNGALPKKAVKGGLEGNLGKQLYS